MCVKNTEQLQLRLTKNQKMIIRQVAKQEHLTMTAYVKHVLFKHFDKENIDILV